MAEPGPIPTRTPPGAQENGTNRPDRDMSHNPQIHPPQAEGSPLPPPAPQQTVAPSGAPLDASPPIQAKADTSPIPQIIPATDPPLTSGHAADHPPPALSALHPPAAEAAPPPVLPPGLDSDPARPSPSDPAPSTIGSDPTPLRPVTDPVAQFDTDRAENAAKTALTRPESQQPTAPPDLVTRHILPQIGVPGTVSVTLAPAELGTLQFEVTQRGDGLHLHLIVDQPATLDLLRRQADQMLAELRQAGFAQTSLSFASTDSQTGDQTANHRHSDDPPPAASPPGAERSGPISPPPRLTALPGTLDLRL